VSTDLDVPAVGKVKKGYVIAGGAAVAGFVGYAWLTRARGSASGSGGEGLTTADTATMPTVTTTTVPDNADVISTNAQWTQRAVELLANTGGWDASYIATTLGKFLARRGLTPAEEDVALAALATLGQPPQGGPYTVTAAPVAKPSPIVVVAAPAQLNVRRVSATVWALTWTPVPGATSYQVRSVTGHTGDPVRTVAGTSYTAHVAQRGGHLAFEVRARIGNAVSAWTRRTVIGT